MVSTMAQLVRYPFNPSGADGNSLEAANSASSHVATRSTNQQMTQERCLTNVGENIKRELDPNMAASSCSAGDTQCLVTVELTPNKTVSATSRWRWRGRRSYVLMKYKAR